MKRKIALLLAAVMALTVVPATSAVAATSNSLTKVPTIVGYSVLYEENWLAREKETWYGGGPTTDLKSMAVSGICGDVDYVIEGTDLVIQVSQTNKLKAGDRFKVVLDNAVWFFRGRFPQTDLSLIAPVTDLNTIHYRQPFTVLSYINGGSFFGRVGAMDEAALLPNTNFSTRTTPWAFSLRPRYETDPITGDRELVWDKTVAINERTIAPWHAEPLMANAVPSTAGAAVTLNGLPDYYVDFETQHANGIAPMYIPTLGLTIGDQPLGAFTVIPTTNSSAWNPTITGTYWSGGLTYDPRKGIWGSSGYIDSSGDPIEGDYYRLPQIMFPGDFSADGIGVAEGFGILDSKTGTPFGQGGLDGGYFEADASNLVYGNSPTGLASWNNVREVPYKLSVNRLQDNEATITILNDIYNPAASPTVSSALADIPPVVTQYGGQGFYHEVRIPLVIRTTEEKEDVKVKIDPQNIAAISSGTWLFSQTSGGGTVTVADGIDTARENFWIDYLKIKEVRISSIPSQGIFFVKTADHFEWRDPNADATFVEVGVLHGLSWGMWSANGFTFTAYPRDGIGHRRLYWADVATSGYSGFLWNVVGAVGSNGVYTETTNIYDQFRTDWASKAAVAGDYEIGYRITGTNPVQYDKKILEVAYRGIVPSTDVPGAIYLKDLAFVAEENAPYGDIMFSIGNVSSNKPVTPEKFKAGVRADWDIILKAEGTIPELINGRYRSENPVYTEDGLHKTARVFFGEASVAAWWAERQTVFTLNEQAKFRKVEILDGEIENLPAEYEAALLGRYESNWKDVDGNFVAGPQHPTDAGVYINDGEKHGYVVVNGNTMTWNDLKIKPDKRASVRFDAWVSIESGFEGDVKLSVAGSAIPEQSNGNGVPAITIAKAISPVKVVAKVKDIKIGYQFQQTEDIIITETKAGMLEKDKQVFVSVSDLISTDLAFSNETKVAVTAGNLKIKDINSSGIGYNALARQGDTLIAGQGGTINFTVSAASSAASTITISNVAVKIDRTIPESNLKPYKVIVWGPTVAPNYIYHNYNKFARDKFGTPGIMTDYIKVVSAANDKTNVLQQEVKVTIGERYFTVNGVTEEMDAEAYISPASNSTMVPVRFISKAFGLKDEQVIWDDANKTVTILSPIRVVQFQANSTTMKLDGVAVEMYSPDQKPVAAEIVNARMYVPFRAMGEAFGITVVWDEANKTAIYNPKVSAATEAAPAAAEAPAAAPATR